MKSVTYVGGHRRVSLLNRKFDNGVAQPVEDSFAKQHCLAPEFKVEELKPAPKAVIKPEKAAE